MREIVGCRSLHRAANQTYFFDDGVFGYEIELRSNSRWSYRDRMNFKRAIGKRLFGDTEFLIGLGDDYMDRILRECVGKTESEISEIVGRYRSYREVRRAERDEKFVRWAALREKFGGIVIGLDSKADVYETGFSVRVLFNTKLSFEDRRDFLKKNRIEFVRWAIGEISDSKGICRSIGDIRFYRPVEIINLRANEAEIKFEVKEDLDCTRCIC